MKEINIISFDIPFPPNYGGIIDVFYKIKFFHSMGLKVHLHCFEYGRERQEELEKYCATVSYYKRKVSLLSHISLLPYIVKSRISKELKHNLLKNDFPILFEGLHTTYLLNDRDLNTRLKIYREHNIEHDYYRQLGLIENNTFKRLYYNIEAKKLKKYENIISKADISLVVSYKDLEYFKVNFPQNEFAFVPAFHSGNDIKIKKGRGDYVLYHGNLSVTENSNAVEYIINNIFNEIDIPLVIAGLNPDKDLKMLIGKYKNITLVPNPDDRQISNLIANAQINLLYTNQATGLKLKLLNVLYNGRHCLVNSKMVEGTSLADICTVKDSPDEAIKAIMDLFKKEISSQEVSKRKQILERDYANKKSFNTIIDAIG